MILSHHDYRWALLGLVLILTTLFIQWIFATVSKGRLPNAIPGKIPQDLGHESFVYRANRTYMNTLENISFMLGSSFVAMFAGVDAFWLALCIWIFAIARIMHMLLYYVIATEKNPSPRSYFFILGLFSNVFLLGLAFVKIL